MKQEEMKKAYKEALAYEDYEEFNAELGWCDWMSDVLADAGHPTTDGEPLDEPQARILEDVTKRIFNQAQQRKAELQKYLFNKIVNHGSYTAHDLQTMYYWLKGNDPKTVEDISETTFLYCYMAALKDYQEIAEE